MGNHGHSGNNYYQFKEYVEKGVIDLSKLRRRQPCHSAFFLESTSQTFPGYGRKRTSFISSAV